MTKNSTLEYLDLMGVRKYPILTISKGCGIGDSGVKSIALGLYSNTTLTTLHLGKEDDEEI